MDLLKAENIRTNADLAAWCIKNGRKGESRYCVLVRQFGEVNADRIVRLLEVAEWDLREVN